MQTPAIPPQYIVQGLNKTYDAWEFRPSRLVLLPLENIVCISCRMVLPARRVFNYIGYHRSVVEFLIAEPGNMPVYSYIMIAALDQDDALAIIADIKLARPELNKITY